MQHSVCSCFSSECRQSSNLGDHAMLSYHALPRPRFCFLFLFLIPPFGTLIMSYCDAVGSRRSGCLQPVTGPAPQRVQQHSVAPCLALTPRFPSCWSHPARASGTSCHPCDSLAVASPFCHGSLPAQGCVPSPVRCRRKWHGSGNLGAPCSGS